MPDSVQYRTICLNLRYCPDGGTTETSAPVSIRNRFDVFGSCMCMRCKRLLSLLLLSVADAGLLADAAAAWAVCGLALTSVAVESTPRSSRRKKYTVRSGYQPSVFHTCELENRAGNKTSRSSHVYFWLAFHPVGCKNENVY